MNRTISAFSVVAVLTGLLMALGFGLQIKGYGFGALGNERLDGLAGSASFIPLAAIYALAAMLIMIAPLRMAGLVHAYGAVPLYSCALVLFAAITGVQAARFAFGQTDALWVLVDWQFIFALAILAVHIGLDTLRRNLLLRTLSFIAFAAATLACLYWTFQF